MKADPKGKQLNFSGSTSFDFSGARCIVTGAASGIGAQTAQMMLDSGARVLAIDVQEPPAGWSLRRSRDVTFARCDVRHRDEVATAVDKFAAAQDGIDCVVTAAGIYGRNVLLDDLDEDDVRAVIDVNVLGTLWTVQAAMPYLRLSQGNMVCVGSVAGRMGGVRAGAHYAASKGAIHAIVRSLAKSEAAHGVRANGVAPGPVATPMIDGRGYSASEFPLHRIAEPDELARSICFLASSSSSYTTGAVLDVNGGIHVS